jgi:hypothetical protein
MRQAAARIDRAARILVPVFAATARIDGGGAMATFVLVHGAWHGGWSWKHVRPLLQAKGHEVYADPHRRGREEPSLEPRHTPRDARHRWEELSDVVLCGHS